MARLAGVDLPRNKRMIIALTYIYGIGPTRSAKILAACNISEDLRKICDEINNYYPSPRQKANWEWRTHFKSKVSKIEQDTTEEQIHELLDQKFKELRDFEEKLLAKLGK